MRRNHSTSVATMERGGPQGVSGREFLRGLKMRAREVWDDPCSHLEDPVSTRRLEGTPVGVREGVRHT